MGITLEYIYNNAANRRADVYYKHVIVIYHVWHMDFTPYKKWLNENVGIEGDWILDSHPYHAVLYLKTEEDAMAFKLRWT